MDRRRARPPLHDAGHDIRTPTHELTIARDVLRSRRRLASQPPGWALSPDGLRQAGPAASLRPDRRRRAWAEGNDRLALARQMIERRLTGRRASSKLPELIELVMARVSAGMVVKTLEVTPQAAPDRRRPRSSRDDGEGEVFGRGDYLKAPHLATLNPLACRFASK